MEQWRAASVPGYRVSDQGRLIGKRGYVLKQHLRMLGPRGYWAINLVDGGGTRTHMVHVLVCEAFHGARPPGRWVAHGDGDSRNNWATNLRWATPAENRADADRHGTSLRGEGHPKHKLTEVDVLAIRAAEGRTNQQLAEQYGVSSALIRLILRREKWRHL